jgi:hypothetical protein
MNRQNQANQQSTTSQNKAGNEQHGSRHETSSGKQQEVKNGKQDQETGRNGGMKSDGSVDNGSHGEQATAAPSGRGDPSHLTDNIRP